MTAPKRREGEIVITAGMKETATKTKFRMSHFDEDNDVNLETKLVTNTTR